MLDYQKNQRIEASEADLLVNTVNTVGVMGAGVALAMKKAFPDIMEPYLKACRDKALVPGTFQITPLSTGLAQPIRIPMGRRRAGLPQPLHHGEEPGEPGHDLFGMPATPRVWPWRTRLDHRQPDDPRLSGADNRIRCENHDYDG